MLRIGGRCPAFAEIGGNPWLGRGCDLDTSRLQPGHTTGWEEDTTGHIACKPTRRRQLLHGVPRMDDRFLDLPAKRLLRIGEAAQHVRLSAKTLIRRELLGFIAFVRAANGRHIQRDALDHAPLLPLWNAAMRIKVKPHLLERFAKAFEERSPAPSWLAALPRIRYFSLAAVRELSREGGRISRLVVEYKMHDQRLWGGMIVRAARRAALVSYDAVTHG